MLTDPHCLCLRDPVSAALSSSLANPVPLFLLSTASFPPFSVPQLAPTTTLSSEESFSRFYRFPSPPRKSQLSTTSPTHRFSLCFPPPVPVLPRITPDPALRTWQPLSPTAVRSPHAELIQQRAAEAKARQAHMDEAWGALLLRDSQGCSACAPAKGAPSKSAAGESAADSLPLTAAGATKPSWGASWQLLMTSSRSLNGWNGTLTAARESGSNEGVLRGDQLGSLSGGAGDRSSWSVRRGVVTPKGGSMRRLCRSVSFNDGLLASVAAASNAVAGGGDAASEAAAATDGGGSGGGGATGGSIVESKSLEHAAHTPRDDLHSLPCSPTLTARRASLDPLSPSSLRTQKLNPCPDDPALHRSPLMEDKQSGMRMSTGTERAPLGVGTRTGADGAVSGTGTTTGAMGTFNEARMLGASSCGNLVDDQGSICGPPIGGSTHLCSSPECSMLYSCAIPSPDASAAANQSVPAKLHTGTSMRRLYRRGTPRKISSCSDLPHLQAAPPAAPLHTPAAAAAGAANAAAISCGEVPGMQVPLPSAHDPLPAGALPCASLPHRSVSSSMLSSSPPMVPVSPPAKTGEKGTRLSQMRKKVSFNSIVRAPWLKPLAEPRHTPRMLRARLCQEQVHLFPQIGSAFSARRLPVGHVAALRVTPNPASPGVSVAGHRRSFSGSVNAPSLHRAPLGTFSVSSHAAASGNAATASDVAADVIGICKPELAAELAAAVEVVERACHVCLAVREQMVAEEQGGYSSGSESEGSSSSSSSVDKKDCSPVTVADFAVQALAALELAQQFPGVPLVGEEDASLLRAHLAAPSARTPSPPAAQAVTGAAVGSATAAAAAGAAGTTAAGAAGGGEQGPSLAERVTNLVLRFASPHALALGGAGEGAVEGSEGRAAAVEAVLGAIDAAAAATHDLDAATTAAPRHTRYWVLDPIDGTRGFLRGHHNQYAVGMALIQDGELVLSALGLPNMPLPRGTSSATQSNDAADVTGSAAAGEVDVESESGDDMWQRPRGQQQAAVCVHIGPRGVAVAAPREGPGSRRAERLACHRAAALLWQVGAEYGKWFWAVQQRCACSNHVSSYASHPSPSPIVSLCNLCKYAAVALGYAAVFIQHPLPGSPHLKVWDHAAGVLCVTEAGGQVRLARSPLAASHLHLAPVCSRQHPLQANTWAVATAFPMSPHAHTRVQHGWFTWRSQFLSSPSGPSRCCLSPHCPSPPCCSPPCSSLFCPFPHCKSYPRPVPP
ncbi:unnamed protein product [Closterium sp. NIES-65]|nr:unnamed protein product [Closterium sp. NIES-65]